MYRFCSLIIDDPKERTRYYVYLFRYFMTKKATVPYLKQWLSDGHDSQVIPEENWNLWVRYRSYWIIREVFTRQKMTLLKVSVQFYVFISYSPIPANFNANSLCVISQ